jgi:hypothetical protein
MSAAAEALLTPHCEPLAPGGANLASRLVSGLSTRRGSPPSPDLAARQVPTLPSQRPVAVRLPPLTAALTALRALAPYAAIELLLPGGSLVALVLWLYRRYKKATPAALH